MLSKTVVAALAAASVASAQTFTDCNPLEKTCPSNPAFGKGKVSCSFSSACDAIKPVSGTDVKYNSNGAVFAIKTVKQAPTFQSDKYIFFGHVDVEIKPAPGPGIVTSLVLQSADLDEIDWEWVGFQPNQAQTNYFGRDTQGTFDRGAFHTVDGALSTTHKYSIDWTSERIQWLVDDNVVRTLTRAQAGTKYPQTPMQVKIGSWVAGQPGAPKGTVEWAGGMADFSKAPFEAHYKNLNIVDYGGGSTATTSEIKEYVYGDKSGSFQSIKVIKADGDSSSSSSSSEKASATSSGAKSTSSAVSTGSRNATTSAASTTLAPSMTSATTSGTAKPTSSNAAMHNAVAAGGVVAAVAGLLAQLL
ncbi:hypothetical protein VHEMI02720 [[Torrubiella] hemipterigena]|uniref:Crh-like protein n=1 Tax=[Torrubiella] hemipterigena TaxID=1531966 RepID=A0A0A1SWN2_9HYPO|nr:hypothetical protein VHEMI02720 [[Torrubiella] hemipterigena]